MGFGSGTDSQLGKLSPLATVVPTEWMFVCSIVQIWYHGIYFNVSCVSIVTRENYKKKFLKKISRNSCYDCNTQTFYKNFHGIRGACLSSDHWRSALGGGGWGCRFCGANRSSETGAAKPEQRNSKQPKPAASKPVNQWISARQCTIETSVFHFSMFFSINKTSGKFG